MPSDASPTIGDSVGTVAPPSPGQPVAYLVILDADDQVRQRVGLVKGQRVTVGRGDNCFIPIDDDSISREHCLLFQVAGKWLLRDLKSRNGTLINDKPVNTDFPLFDGAIFQLGDTRLRFHTAAESDSELTQVSKRNTTDLAALSDEPPIVDEQRASQVLSDPGGSSVLVRSPREIGREMRRERTQHDVVGTAQILDQASRSGFHQPGHAVQADSAAAAHSLSALLQAGSKIGQAETIREASRLALKELLAQTQATFGAVLMLPSTRTADREPDKLAITGFESRREQPYTRVSSSISRLVFDREAGVHILDTASSDEVDGASIDELTLISAVCVPVRLQGRIAGLIHLYSQDADAPLTPQDFHLTLALGDLLTGTFHQLWEKKQAEEKARQAERAADALRDQLAGTSIGEIVGQSESIQRLRDQIGRVAPTEATVLVRGESGVGKELVGRAMHFSSRRASGPFVTMNCAALTESLLESELFGHEKGSFTGATAKKKGKFEQADGGTLMLDEVGEMSLEIQAKFLRVLEGHPFERVGGAEPIATDVRVVAATNRDLEAAVREGTFRKDLYFRLHVIVVTIDPLRRRPSDVPLLAQHFIERVAPKAGRSVKGLTAEATEFLSAYRWPGNVRELQNTIERAVILCRGELIDREDIQLCAIDALEDIDEIADPLPEEQPATGDAGFRELTIEELEREHILTTLTATEWNKTKAASMLGIERSTLDRKLKRYGVRRPDDAAG